MPDGRGYGPASVNAGKGASRLERGIRQAQVGHRTRPLSCARPESAAFRAPASAPVLGYGACEAQLQGVCVTGRSSLRDSNRGWTLGTVTSSRHPLAESYYRALSRRTTARTKRRPDVEAANRGIRCGRKTGREEGPGRSLRASLGGRPGRADGDAPESRAQEERGGSAARSGFTKADPLEGRAALFGAWGVKSFSAVRKPYLKKKRKGNYRKIMKRRHSHRSYWHISEQYLNGRYNRNSDESLNQK